MPDFAVTPHAMSPEMREIIQRSRWHLGAVKAVAALLPADDLELDRLIERAVADNEIPGFVYIVVAALGEGRPVDARHLRRGGPLIPDQYLFASMAGAMQGDVADAVLDALEHTTLTQEMRAMGLFAAAAWWRRNHQDEPFPQGIVAEARSMGRNKALRSDPAALLLSLAGLTGDDGLLTIAGALLSKEGAAQLTRGRSLAEAAKDFGEKMAVEICMPILSLVPAEEPNVVGGSYTVRRSVARINRNELCPCGSGRKYKRCCEAADRKRLRLSSEVAGKTQAEVRADPEQYLTRERLDGALPADIARFDPLKIAPDLVPLYLQLLATYRYCDRVTEAFELIGWSPGVHGEWDLAVFMITHLRRRDLLERMIALHPSQADAVSALDAGARLLLTENDPAATVRVLEEIAVEVLRAEDPDALHGIAFNLLYGQQSALSALIARSVIPLIDKGDALTLIDGILPIRDRFDLPPDDPFAEIVEKRYDEETESHGNDAEALRAALERLEAKASEVRRLNESLHALRQDIDQREKASPAAATGGTTNTNDTSSTTGGAAQGDAQILADLRQKVALLKSDLKERHAERSTLRHDLEKAHADLETLRKTQRSSNASSEPAAAANGEDNLLLPASIEGHQPLRTIEFPRKFNETLQGHPRAVGRGALALLGRLAAGESAAFHGVVRLKAVPDVFRARIGIDHRLLFRLLTDRVQVVDLINRQDLERRIKTLATT
jgi:hypothetical protein